jgi:putative addiction module component (TIGR02574 family)
MDLETLAREAAQLSRADPHALLDHTVDALTSTAERHVADAWDEEIARRIQDLDSGAATAVPWNEVKGRLYARRASR